MLYLAEDLSTSLYETIIRDRFDFLDRTLEEMHYSDSVAFEISTKPAAPLTLLDLTGSNAAKCGVPTDVTRYSKRDAGQAFAEYVHADMPSVDGILYESRFTGSRSVAVFDRAVKRLLVTDTSDLDRTLVHSALSGWNITVR